MHPDTSERLNRIRGGLVKIRHLRDLIRHAENRTRRDAAIILYSRTLDAMLEEWLALEETGALADLARRAVLADEDTPF